MTNLEFSLILFLVLLVILWLMGLIGLIFHLKYFQWVPKCVEGVNNWFEENISKPISRFFYRILLLILGIVFFYLSIRMLHFFWTTDINTLIDIIDEYMENLGKM